MPLPEYVLLLHFLCQFNITKSQNRLNIDKLVAVFQNVTWILDWFLILLSHQELYEHSLSSLFLLVY